MKLAKREKLFVGVGACILGLFLIVALLNTYYFDKKNRLAKGIINFENNIETLAISGAGSQNTDEASGDIERVLSNRNWTLSSFVNKEAEAIGLLKNLKKRTPSTGKMQGDYLEDITKVELEAITTSQLIEYLYRIEKPEQFIYVKKITFPINKEGYLAPIITVLTYKKEDGSGQ